VVLAQGGVEKYRWSAGKAFTQAVEDVTIQPGKKWSTAVNDTIAVPAGEYDLHCYRDRRCGRHGNR